jgi:hypothetical protein
MSEDRIGRVQGAILESIWSATWGFLQGTRWGADASVIRGGSVDDMWLQYGYLMNRALFKLGFGSASAEDLASPRASISRAVRRLEERGLVECAIVTPDGVWRPHDRVRYIKLTEDGWGQALLVVSNKRGAKADDAGE